MKKWLTIFVMIGLFCHYGAGWADSRALGTPEGISGNALLPGEVIPGQGLIAVAGDFDASQIAGADYLKHMQADITDDNAGNGTNGVDETPDDPDDGGWDWRVTSPPAPFFHTTSASPVNIYGATAAGLYYTYLETGDATYFTALTDAANVMKVNAGIWSASDIIFLMNYNDLPGVAGTSYADSAKAKFDARITSQGSATALAQHIRDVRFGQGYGNGIIAWDVAAFVIAAAMLDDRYPGDPNNYAQAADDMAEVLWQDSFNDNPGYFDIIDDAGWDPAYDTLDYYWYTLGLTGLIDAFNFSNSHTGEIPGLVTRLLDSQYSFGAISYCYGANPNDEDWQSTAYAMVCLGRLDRPTYQAAINRMAFWISATQDASGGWRYTSGNHYPEVGGECTAGLYYSTNDVTDVLVDDSFTSQDDVDIYNTANGTYYVWGYDAFAVIQDGIDAVTGSTVNIANGTYYETLDINKNLILTGESESGVIIDASGFSDYGIYVTGDYTVTLQNFTLTGPTPPTYGYGVKVSGENADITLNNITSQNCGRSGIDINGAVAGLIQNVTSLSNGGVGLALTDCENVTVSGITTSGNSWGGIGIYTQGTYHTGGSDNITITGTNSISDIPPIYTETGGGYPITNLNISISDFPYTVGNNLAANITGYFADLTTAAAAAIGADPVNSFINDRSDGSFVVPSGLTIQAAVIAADPGDVINVLTGTFNESVTFDKGVILTGAGTAQTFVTGGLAIAAGVSGLSVQDIYLTGSAVSGQNAVIRALGTNTDFTIDYSVIDGEGVAGRYGYTGGSMEGNVTITNCEMKNLPGWALWDSRSGSGGDGSAMDTITFADNYIHDCDGSVVFRGLSTDRTDVADVYGNTWEDIGDNYAVPSQHWAAFEMNRTIDFSFYNNTIDGVALGQWGEGQGLQVWDIDNLDVHDNDFINCYQGIWVYGGGSFAVPGGSIYHNDLWGSTDYAVGVDATCTGFDTLDAEENYWGTVNYSAISAQMQGAVDFNPWCLDITHTICNLVYPLTEVWVDDDWAGSLDGEIVGGHVFGYDAFATVEDGIEAVSGSTVNVAAGTYVEGPQIVIDKNITIIGESKYTTIITPSASTGSSGDSRGWFLVQAGFDLNLSNVTLDGSGYQIYQAIRAFGTGTLNNNIFQNIVYSNYIGFVLAHLDNWDVTDNTFSNIGRVGILSYGTGVTSSNISGNTYTGKGSGDWLDYAFEAGAGAIVTISSNTITNCIGVALSDSSTSAGIIATTYFGWGTEVTISGNDISASTDGICIGFGSSDSTTCVINGGNLLHNNDNGISTSSSTGITLTVNQNAIYDNSDWGLYASGGPTVDAEANWWGDASGPGEGTTLSGRGSSAGARPSDINGDGQFEMSGFLPNNRIVATQINSNRSESKPEAPVILLIGTGDNVSTEVDYSPWWGANYVADPHSTPWNWYVDNSNASTIQEGVDLASDHDTVHVTAASYSESVSIIKPLALLGDSGAVNDVGNPNLTAIDIASSDVTIDNLTLTNCRQGILIWLEPSEYSVSPGYANVRLTNNIISNTNGSRGFGIYAGTESERFNPADPLGIYDPSLTGLLDFSGLYIFNNTISYTSQAAIVLQSMKGVADTIRVKFNDISDTPYSGVWIDAAQNLVISNNTLHNCGYGVFMSDYADGYYEGSPDDQYDPKDIYFGYNQVFNNDYGFAIYDCWPALLTFFHNRMMGHTNYAVYNFLNYNVDATYNYWGSDRGPTHSGNIYGDGDNVTDYVIYDPWCNYDFTVCGYQAGLCVYVVGDVNGNLGYNGLDIIYGVNFFKGGPPPVYECECTPNNTWYVAGDVNASCSYNGLDITYGVSFFKGGPVPQPCADCEPVDLLSGEPAQPESKGTIKSVEENGRQLLK